MLPCPVFMQQLPWGKITIWYKNTVRNMRVAVTMSEPCLKTGVRLWIPFTHHTLKISLKYSLNIWMYSWLLHNKLAACGFISLGHFTAFAAVCDCKVECDHFLVSETLRNLLNSSEYWIHFWTSYPNICEHKDSPHKNWEWGIVGNSTCFQRNYISKHWNIEIVICRIYFIFFWFSAFILKKFNDTFSCGCCILGSKRCELYQKRKAKVYGRAQADVVSWRKSPVPHGSQNSV